MVAKGQRVVCTLLVYRLFFFFPLLSPCFVSFRSLWLALTASQSVNPWASSV